MEIDIPVGVMPDIRQFIRTYDHLLTEMEVDLQVCRDSLALQHDLISCSGCAISNNNPISALRCRLSDHHLRANRDSVAQLYRTEMERQICCRLHAEVTAEAAATSLLTPGWVEHVSGLAKGEPLREDAATTLPDAYGAIAIYPDASNILPVLAQLSQFVRQFGEGDPLAAAIVASSLFLNLHPLVDGNGRVTRVAFNFIVQRALNIDFFLPLYEIQAASAGGWTYAHRVAWFRGDWSVLVTFFRSAIHLFSDKSQSTLQ
ncbi:MAG TPA: Fic family protein [Allosphingosinicella sp.]|nr:Fic family protein [Allosphingosinicella sp.]